VILPEDLQGDVPIYHGGMITLLSLNSVELLVLIVSLMQDVAKLSQRKSEKLKVVVSGLQELQAKDQRISEEQQKNIYL
jgi:hypothetical protein